MNFSPNSRDNFATMLAMQADLQLKMPDGTDPRDYTTEEACHFIQWNFTALVAELSEALNEIGWKPWATSRHINRDAYMKEMVDAWHFFMNMILAVSPDMSVSEITDEFIGKYAAKHVINAKRQEDGYDGVAGKCKVCHRELDEDGDCEQHGETIKQEMILSDHRR